MSHEPRKLKVVDPVRPQPEVCGADRGAGLSAFDPPDAYAPPAPGQVAVAEMHPFLQGLVEEHRELKGRLDELERCLATVLEERALSRAVFERLQSFFDYFDKDFVAHNRMEERRLFPLLKARLIAKGEHSQGEELVTGVDVLQNEHVAALKAVASVTSLLSVIPQLPDRASREVVLDLAVGTGNNFIELLNLHIFREDHIMFSLAQTLLTPEELDELART